MTPPLLSPAAATPSTASLPPSAPNEGSKMASPASTFSRLLAGENQEDDPKAHGETSLACAEGHDARSGTAQEHSGQDAPEDNRWPPEGLASLWLPAAPEPMQALAPPTANPQPLPATVSPAAGALAATSPHTASTAISADTLADASITATATANSLELESLVQPGEPHDTFDHSAFSLLQEPPLQEKGWGERTFAGASPLLPASERSGDTPPPAALVRVAVLPPSLQEQDVPVLGEKIQGEGIPVPGTVPMSAAPPPPAHFQTAQPPPPSTATAPFPTPDLHADDFPGTLSPHIQWLAEHKIGHAHLHLNPQEMGPIEVRLTLDGNQLHADFTSAAPEVRQALEHGLPRLRDLLGESGLNLAQGQISQQSSQRHAPPSAQIPAGFASAPSGEEPAPTPTIQPAAALHLLDAYA